MPRETAATPASCRRRAGWSCPAIGRGIGRDFRGRVRHVRAFGRPTRLEPGEQVWLVVSAVDLAGTAELNGQPLGPLAGFREPTRFEVTDRLAERNELVIEVELPPLAEADEQRLRRAGLPGGLIGEVRLEIFPPG